MSESFAAKCLFDTVDGPIGCVWIFGAPFWPMAKESLWTLVLGRIITSCSCLEKHFGATNLIVFVRVVPGMTGLEKYGGATHEEMFIVVIPCFLGLQEELGSNIWWELGRAIA